MIVYARFAFLALCEASPIHGSRASLHIIKEMPYAAAKMTPMMIKVRNRRPTRFSASNPNNPRSRQSSTTDLANGTLLRDTRLWKPQLQQYGKRENRSPFV